jgi:hypothetical protein
MNNSDNQALYSAQEKFLEMIGNSESLGFNIVLCGGTALARAYLHHRISYDLDFFVDGKFDPERLAFLLGRRGLQLSDIQIESGTHFVHQLFGFFKIDEVKLKVSFIEDSYTGMFPSTNMPLGKILFNIESIEGLYHRKLRTVSGSGYGDKPLDGRQAARDLFDLFMLDRMIKPIPAFITEINKSGANFPEKAFIAGLAAMPWIDMMDDFEQLDFNRAEQYLSQVNPADLMAIVRLRLQEVFKEMVHYG